MRTRFAIPVLATVLLLADSPGAVTFTAATANIASAPEPVRIEILRWSTDEERDKLMSAWSLKPVATPGSKAGKGAGKQGKAGKGPGAGGGAAATQSPEAALARALQEAATVGYLWSSEMAGYALRYAGRVENPDGSQRIILITQRKLGTVNQVWRPTVDGASNSYEFSVIELRLNAKGEGEGRISLSGRVAEDAGAKIVAIENYNALPVVFREVRKVEGRP
jgi:hypothetical protein